MGGQAGWNPDLVGVAARFAVTLFVALLLSIAIGFTVPSGMVPGYALGAACALACVPLVAGSRDPARRCFASLACTATGAWLAWSAWVAMKTGIVSPARGQSQHFEVAALNIGGSTLAIAVAAALSLGVRRGSHLSTGAVARLFARLALVSALGAALLSVSATLRSFRLPAASGFVETAHVVRTRCTPNLSGASPRISIYSSLSDLAPYTAPPREWTMMAWTGLALAALVFASNARRRRGDLVKLGWREGTVSGRVVLIDPVAPQARTYREGMEALDPRFIEPRSREELAESIARRDAAAFAFMWATLAVMSAPLAIAAGWYFRR